MTTESFPLAAARGLAVQRAWASDHSRKAFELNSAKVVQHFGPLRPVAEIGRGEIEAWEQVMISEGLSEATIDRRRSALLCCLLAAHRAGHFDGRFEHGLRGFQESEALRQYRAESWRRANERIMQHRIEAWEQVIAAEKPLAGATASRRARFATSLIAAYRAGLLERVPRVMEESEALNEYMAGACRRISQRLMRRKPAHD